MNIAKEHMDNCIRKVQGAGKGGEVSFYVPSSSFLIHSIDWYLLELQKSQALIKRKCFLTN